MTQSAGRRLATVATGLLCAWSGAHAATPPRSALGRTRSASLSLPQSPKGDGSFDQDRGPSGPVSEAERVKVQRRYGQLPLSFEANQGQTDERVQFLARGDGYSLFLTRTESVLALRGPADPGPAGVQPVPEAGEGAPQPNPGSVLRMTLLGGSPTTRATGLDELPGKSHYFVGNDPKQWRTNVPNYGKVRFAGVYPGVDLLYYGNQGQLEYDFVVAPGADPSAIRLGFAGAERLEIDNQGELTLHTRGGEVSWQKPVVYQEVGGIRQMVDGHYVRKGTQAVGFAVAPFDARLPLVIDPVLVYSTYLGSTTDGVSIAVDSSGSAYVTGRTSSATFPTTSGAFMPQPASLSDAFVAKMDPAGDALIYSTYLGGNGNNDVGAGIAVDSSGSAHVTGETNSANFPTTLNAYSTGRRGSIDAFLTKLDPAGSALLYSTYLGGGGDDRGFGVAADSAGYAYVTGHTHSVDFPTRNAPQTTWRGTRDAFVTKLDTNLAGLASLVYSTYLGGSLEEDGYVNANFSGAIAVDSSGHVYVTGSTNSPDFPIFNAFQSTLLGGFNPNINAFVARLDTNLSGPASVIYSTYLGTGGSEFGTGIAVDSSGSAYVTGYGQSVPTTSGVFQASSGGVTDAFVTKLTPDGSDLVYSTYLGGSNHDLGLGIAVDPSGYAYVTGYTPSHDFPVLNAVQASFGGRIFDAFVTKLEPDGSGLVFSTYLGGSGDDFGRGIAADASGAAYVTGTTNSANFPMANPFWGCCVALSSAFVSKIGENAPPFAVDDGPYPISEDSPLTVAAPGVLANDTDAEGGPLTAFQFSDAAHGSVTLDADGSFTYIPLPNYSGPDEFFYRARDQGQLTSRKAKVSIVVTANNAAPVATDDSYVVAEDDILNVAAAGGVLANDTDADNDPLSAIKDSDPLHGTLAFSPDGSFTYTPLADYNGPDRFTYRAFDGQVESAVATVTINVGAVNDPPVAADDVFSIAEDNPLTTAPSVGVLANDVDLDSPALDATRVSDPAHGTVDLRSDGSFTYTPAANYNGGDSFTYKANDTLLDSNVATVTILVTPVEDLPIAGNVTIAGTPTVGSVLTGGYTYGDVDGDAEGASTFQWLRGGLAIGGASGGTYTVAVADLGQVLAFQVTPVSLTGASPGSPATSAGLTILNSAPTATGASITGTPTVGSVLTGHYTYGDVDGDAEGASTFQWLRDGVFQGANIATYVVEAADVGHRIALEVTPVAAAGTSPGAPATSAGMPILDFAAQPTSITISPADPFVEFGPFGQTQALQFYALGGSPPVQLGEVRAVDPAAGGSHTCALLVTGMVQCWGANGAGQLGTGSFSPATSLAPVAALLSPSAVQVAASRDHTCARMADGTVRCWGSNGDGQLGNGTTIGSSTAVAVNGLSGATAIAAGGRHTCALLATGGVQCWGDNGAGQLGDGTTAGSGTPVAVNGLSGATAIAAGGGHTCALLNTGRVQCWGSNGNGQLGNGTTVGSSTPVVVYGLGGATAITAGSGHTCALLNTGGAQCWGDNDTSQLGDGTTMGSGTPVAVNGLGGATAIAAGGGHTCALLTVGGVQCWGDNAAGQLGDGTAAGAVAITAGGLHTCALLATGRVTCWGGNASGQLGDGTTTGSSTPVPTSPLGTEVTWASSNPALATIGPSTGLATVLFERLGNTTITAAYGALSASTTLTLGQQNTAPPVLILPASVTAEATGPAGVVVTYAASSMDAVDGPGPVSCTPPSGSLFPLGLTTINCAATNSRGNTATGTFTVTVNVPNQAPVITSANATTFSVGTFGSFTVRTTGVPTPTITETGALPNGVTFLDQGDGTATLSGTPGPGTGRAYPLTFSAMNAAGSTGPATFTLTVNEAPAITSANATTLGGYLGGSTTFTIRTIGFPTPAITQAGTLPSGITFVDNGDGTGTLQGQPTPGTGGTYPLTFTATNVAGSTGPVAFALTTIQLSTITSGSATTFLVGVAGSFTIQTAGLPTPTITQTGALPYGVTFVDNGDGSATLSGTPAAGYVGTYPLTFWVSNAVGSSGPTAFTLTVNQAPAITSVAAWSFLAGAAHQTFTVTATGFPAPAIAQTGALPDGVLFIDNGDGTATLQGYPAAGTGGSYALIFTATNAAGASTPQAFTLTVSESPRITSQPPPILTPIFAVGTAASFTVTTAGFPQVTITLTGALPSGVTFVDNRDGTATLSGTPSAGAGGDYALRITAANGQLPDAVQDLILRVIEAPAITSQDATTFTAGTPGTFTVTTNGFPKPRISLESALWNSVAAFVDNGDGTATLSGTPGPGTGGTWALTIRAASATGLATQAFTLRVNEAPAISSANHTTFTVGMIGSFTVTASGYPKPVITQVSACLPIGSIPGPFLPRGLLFGDNGDGTGALRGAPEAGTGGACVFQFRASNGLAPDDLQYFTLTVNEAPAITSANATTFMVGTRGAFTVRTTGYPTPTPLLTGNLPRGVFFVENGDGTGTLVGTPLPDTWGSYALSFTAASATGSSIPQAFTLRVNEAPAITSANAATFTVGRLGSFTITTSGFPRPVIDLQTPFLPSGLSFIDHGDGTATLSGAAALGTGGSYPKTLTATNADGVSTPPLRFTLTVIEAPAITSANATTFFVGGIESFTVRATGFPAPALTLVGGSLPGGVTFLDNGDGTGRLRGPAASGTAGSYALTFSAANAAGVAAPQAFTLDLYQAPAFTSANAATFTVGIPRSFVVTTTGFPAPQLSWTGALPSGLSFFDNGNGTATLSGTPAPGTAGTYPLTLFERSAAGSATQAFTLTVVNTPGGNDILVDLGGGTSVAGGVSVQFPTVTTAGTTTLTYPGSCPALPSGFSVGTPAVCYDVATTAAYSTPPPVQVCINYSGISFGSGPIMLLHYQGAAWVNVTTSLDTATQVVCGGVSSLSPFVVARSVVGPPSIAKAFGAAAIKLFGRTSLTFTLKNPNATALHGIRFTDKLPPGLIVAIPNGRKGSCGGAVTAVPASNSISLMAGTLAAGASCSVSVNVIGLTVGLKTNTTGDVTSTEGGRGGTASAQLLVQSPADQPNCQSLLESTLTRLFGGLPQAAAALGLATERELQQAIQAACQR